MGGVGGSEKPPTEGLPPRRPLVASCVPPPSPHPGAAALPESHHHPLLCIASIIHGGARGWGGGGEEGGKGRGRWRRWAWAWFWQEEARPAGPELPELHRAEASATTGGPPPLRPAVPEQQQHRAGLSLLRRSHRNRVRLPAHPRPAGGSDGVLNGAVGAAAAQAVPLVQQAGGFICRLCFLLQIGFGSAAVRRLGTTVHARRGETVLVFLPRDLRQSKAAVRRGHGTADGSPSPPSPTRPHLNELQVGERTDAEVGHVWGDGAELVVAATNRG